MSTGFESSESVSSVGWFPSRFFPFPLGTNGLGQRSLLFLHTVNKYGSLSLITWSGLRGRSDFKPHIYETPFHLKQHFIDEVYNFTHLILCAFF
jgi:hypothetical protein